MIPAQNTKAVIVVSPAAIVDNGSYTVNDVDCKDWDYAQFFVVLGATDIAMAALKLQESDDDSTYTDIDELDFSDTAQLDIDGAALGLPADDDDNKIFAMEVNLIGRKRYLRLVATAGDGAAGTYLAAIAILSRGSQTPVTAAERGCAQIARV